VRRWRRRSLVGLFGGSCLLMLSVTARGAPPRGPDGDGEAGNSSWNPLLWTDGVGTMISADSGGRCVEAPSLDRVCQADAAGRPRILVGAVGESVVAALADEAGALWRFDGTRWGVSTLPPDAVASLRTLAVSADGQIFGASASQLFRWDGARWATFELPAPLRETTLAMVASPGGRLYLGRRGDVVWTFSGRKFDRVVYGGISAEAMAGELDGLAYQASENILWFVTQSGFLGRIDLEGGTARDWRLPASLDASGIPRSNSGETWRIAGYEKPGGYEVFLARGRSIYSREMDRFVWRGDANGRVGSVWPERHGSRLVVVTTAGDRQVLDGTIRREDVHYTLSDVEESRMERAARRRPAPPMVREGRLVPDLGVRFGVATNLGADRGPSSFRFEGSLGVLVAPVAPSVRGISFWIWPRVGTKIDTNRSASVPGLFGDVGLGVGSWLVMGAAHVGASLAFKEGSTRAGVRYSGGVYSMWGTVGIEAHLEEIAPVAAPVRSACVLFTLNLAPVVWLASVLGKR
jgi:hypothetical protein